MVKFKISLQKYEFFFYFVYNWEKNELTDHICSCDLEADLGLVSQYKQGHTVSSRWYWCLKLKFQARAPCCPCIQFFFAQAYIRRKAILRES